MPDEWLKREKAPTVTNLGRLLARMALDEDLYRQFDEDPEAVITAAGLSEAEAEALRDGDWNAIKQHLGPGARPLHQEDGGP